MVVSFLRFSPQTINKKLRQIEQLKQLEASGKVLSEQEKKKISDEAQLREELKKLKL
jgi:uncharacterized protein with WD repeat